MPDCPPLLPMVSIHVAICNDLPDRVRRTLAALAALDYPAFEVLVVDHNTADPKLWEPVARDCARLGTRFRFFHLGPWPAGRAGALNFARTQTFGRTQYIAVLDGDTVVTRDWLRGAMPAFADPEVAVARSPYIVRTAALDGVGGWAEWAITEEAALDLALLMGRWRSVHPAVQYDRAPASIAIRRQRIARRAYGAAQIGRRHWRLLFSPFDHELTLRQRWRVIAGWLPWIGDALGLLFLALNLAISAGLAMGLWRFGVAIFLCTLPPVGLLACKVARLRGIRIEDAFIELSLSHTVARAFWNAVVGSGAPRLHPVHPVQTPIWTDSPIREELTLLLLISAVLAGILVVLGFVSWWIVLWCAVLLLQSAPYLASLSIAAAAAMRTRQSDIARSGLDAVARTGAGD